MVGISTPTMLGDLVGVPSSAIELYIGKLAAPLGALVGVTITMGDHICEAVGNLAGGNVGEEVGSPDGSRVVGEYVGVSVIVVFVGFFDVGALVSLRYSWWALYMDAWRAHKTGVSMA